MPPSRAFVFTVLLSLLSVPVLAGDVPDEKEIEAAVQRACDILLGNQEAYRPDRGIGRLPDDKLKEWQEKEKERLADLRKKVQGEGQEWPYEGVYRVGPDGRIPPGYRVGGTAIVCYTLLEAPDFNEERRDAIDRGVDFMLRMIHEDPGMASKKQTNYDVRGWGWAYAMKFFLRGLEKEFFEGERLARVKTTIPHLIACLKEGQVPGGGWNYAGRRVSPFMTGSTLIALFQAKEMGFEVDDAMVASALDALEKGRDENRAFAYSGVVRSKTEPMEGASARSAVAELCLYRAGRSDVDSLRTAVKGFFNEDNWEQLLVRKSQQGTHVRPYGVAPYYFFYGHTYAALAAEHLPKKERAEYREMMRDLLWRTLEPHGGWNDRIFPRTESFSTAMSVLSLIAPDLPKVPKWSADRDADL